MSPSLTREPIVDSDDERQYAKPKGTTMISNAASTVLHRSLTKEPLNVIAGKGQYLYLDNGQKILDATGGAAVSCLGHGNERVRDALLDQMQQVAYCHSFFYGTNAAEELAKLLIDSTGGVMARAFFPSSGSEAMEAALKFARQYYLEKIPPEPERVRFVARQQSYHGNTLGTLGVGGHTARRALFEPLLSGVGSQVSPCYAYRGAGLSSAGNQYDGDERNEAAYLRQLEDDLEAEFQRLGPSTIAAFVAEPVVGAALGCVPPIPGYFGAVRRVCDRYGVLLIFDEVMCGAGRIGPEPTKRWPKPLHAFQDPLVGVEPDIMTLAKGLGGGFVPVAAMLVNARVVDTLRRGSGAFSHGQTYQGHPLACRAALEVQRIIRDDNLVANVRRQGALLGRLLSERLASHPAVGDIRGKGLFWGIEFVADSATKQPFPLGKGVAMGIHELGLREPYNISLYPGNGSADGHAGDHIIVAPAYTVTADDIRDIVDRVTGVIEEYFASSSLLPRR